MVAFSFYLYFHIRTSNKNIRFINAKMGVVKGVVRMFPTTYPPLLLQFSDDTTGERHRTKGDIHILRHAYGLGVLLVFVTDCDKVSVGCFWNVK